MIRALYLALFVTAYLRADIYEVENVTEQHSVTTTYRYGQGGSVRLQQIGSFRYQYTVIWNQERQTAYEIDEITHQYREPWKSDFITLLAAWVARPHVRHSGKTVDIYYTTADTGGRRDMLGHTAKRLRVQEQHVAPAGACNPSSFSEDDGWYITYPQQELGSLGSIGEQAVYRHYGSDEIDICRDKIIQHGVKPNPGLLVFQKNGAHTFEVTALSAAPLNKSLFEPPSNYKKVAYLGNGVAPTWMDRLSWDCDQLIGSLATWF